MYLTESSSDGGTEYNLVPQKIFANRQTSIWEASPDDDKRELIWADFI